MTVARFTKEEFESAIKKSIQKEWSRNINGGCFEYEISFGENAKIFINSSVDSQTNISRDSGKDSIRVWVVYQGKPQKKTQRWVTRIAGWEDRLKHALLDTCNEINRLDYSPKCPNCNGHMVIRKGVHGKFYGCLKFPNCRGTRPYEEPVKELAWLNN